MGTKPIVPPTRDRGDDLAGMYAAIGLLAAVWQRDVADTGAGTGRGRVIDVNLVDSIFSLMEGSLPDYALDGRVRQPVGAAISTAAPTNTYPCADGKWLCVAGNSDPIFQRLMALIGRPDLAADPRFATNAGRCRHAADLDAAIAACQGMPILVAHSLGCMLVAQWAQSGSSLKVAGAFLVAPSDTEAPSYPIGTNGFAPIPMAPLPFPSLVITSSDDPYVSLERAHAFAAAWGSRVVEIGAAGHIIGVLGMSRRIDPERDDAATPSDAAIAKPTKPLTIADTMGVAATLVWVIALLAALRADPRLAAVGIDGGEQFPALRVDPPAATDWSTKDAAGREVRTVVRAVEPQKAVRVLANAVASRHRRGLLHHVHRRLVQLGRERRDVHEPGDIWRIRCDLGNHHAAP